MDAVKELKYFLLVMLGIAFVWLFTGGPLRPESKGPPFFKNPEEKAAQQVTGGGSDAPGGGGQTGASSLAKATLFLSAGGALESDSKNEYVEISAPADNERPVNITGWRLKNKNGLEVKIGQGAKFIFASPNIGSQPQEDILLNPGDRAYVVTGRSPVGTSFRASLCTGYFAQFNDFEPSLPRNCPAPKEENLPRNLSDNCLDFIDNLPRCETPSPIPFDLPESCQAYLNEKINYKTCSELHKNDPDYYGDEWRIYLQRDEELWKQSRETITLLNNNGQVIDSISY